MNKCQHGEKISIFCASQCCVWKQAAGCDHCMKKYHNHMGPTIFLQEDDVAALVKKYTLESNIKPKCRLLQEAVYSYFNVLKTQLTNSIEVASKNAINQIGYPYLYSNNNISTYKRLKNKEYKKLVQKEFRNLYDASQKINQKELIREESKIYLEGTKHIEEIVSSLEEVFKKYETIIKKVTPAFTHDISYGARIDQIIRTLNSQSPVKSKIKQKEVSPIRFQLKPTSSPQKQSPKGKIATETKQNNEDSPKIQHITIPPPQLLKPNYARNASIDKKIVKQNKFLSAGPSKSLKQKQPTLREVKLLYNDKLEQVKHELNNKQLEINEKKKMLIEMMKQKEESIKNAKQQSTNSIIEKKQQAKSILHVGIPSYFKREHSELIVHRETAQTQKSHEADSNLKTQSEDNSHNELELFDNGMKQDEGQLQIKAFTQLPLLQRDLYRQSNVEQVKQKIIIIPKPKELQTMSAKQTINNSPILKKRNSIAMHAQQLQPKNAQQSQIEQKLHKRKSEVLQLKENEQRSLALLLKSLTMNANDAIKYLQSALIQAQNNLSAAQYLSYLYLQQERPQDCLHLCNKMLEKLQNSADSEELSLIINNNKAAALNILGRYSQSILILQRCLRIKEKDCVYKNLGDAYFSISIYEKAIYNYEKSLAINQNYDEAQYNLAVCLYIQQNYYNAKLAIEKALQLHPQNESYLGLLTNIQTRITNY